ncbi:MAG: hypothetical protein LIQ30_12840 [Planctomycetes bacterium]|nr:hypothetical protein [Planctomycetota bacterium]MCC8116993.1 hypothetical protein [Planctomycetota bacterium]MCD7896576.1 hypothetical protein [Planctomycetaceae bacterium]
MFIKGPAIDNEVASACQTLAGTYRLGKDIGYTLPNTDQQRHLVVYIRDEYRT